MKNQYLKFEVTQERLKDMDALFIKCGLKSRKQLINTAMSFFEAAVEESIKGKSIASIDVDAKEFKRFDIAALKHAKSISGK